MAIEDIALSSDALSATILLDGAELRTLRDVAGRDLLWDGDPAFWIGRAPILFPVVGMVAHERIRVDGVAYPMTKHGFARHSRFAPVARDDRSAVLRLEANDETRAHYPFDFRLDIGFALEGATLTLSADIANLGTRPMPASFGFHPAFRWPLPYGASRAEHRLTFERPEPAPIRRIDGDGLLRAETEPSPIDDATLMLRDALFEGDAIILDHPASRALRYGADGDPSLEIAWDLPQLGLWTKPGAGYICIEPWQGYADPAGYDGELADKPGMVTIAPGDDRRFTMRVTLAGTP